MNKASKLFKYCTNIRIDKLTKAKRNLKKNLYLLVNCKNENNEKEFSKKHLLQF